MYYDDSLFYLRDTAKKIFKKLNIKYICRDGPNDIYHSDITNKSPKKIIDTFYSILQKQYPDLRMEIAFERKGNQNSDFVSIYIEAPERYTYGYSSILLLIHYGMVASRYEHHCIFWFEDTRD